MAFDIYVFDLFAAPRDRYDFIDWISRTFRHVDGPGGDASRTTPALQVSRTFRHVDGPGGDASRTTPALQAWQREMALGFPGAGDPHHHDEDSAQASKNASYRFSQSAVQASFDWESSGPALHRAKRAAQLHGVGLFEASGREGAVWMISSRGRWEIVHRNSDGEREFG